MDSKVMDDSAKAGEQGGDGELDTLPVSSMGSNIHAVGEVGVFTMGETKSSFADSDDD